MSNLEKFSPLMLQAWMRAAKEPFTISFEKKATAIAFRHRMYQLRKALRTEDPDTFRTISHLKIKLINSSDPEPWILSFEEADADFEQALLKAGIAPTEAPDFEIDQDTQDELDKYINPEDKKDD